MSKGPVVDGTFAGDAMQPLRFAIAILMKQEKSKANGAFCALSTKL